MTSLMRASDFMPLRQAMDRLFEQAFTTFPFWADGRVGYRVPVDVYEADDRYVVRALLPGVKPEEVQLTCEADVVTLSGEIRFGAPEGLRPVFEEIGTTAFRREIRLPTEIDAAKAEATYQHGVLTLTLPKVEAAVAKRIPIKVSQPVAA